jgi:RNA polymerase sigma-70 factor (ECF subfamily)
MNADHIVAPLAAITVGGEEAAAFESLYLAHREAVFRYLRVVTRDEDEALDVTAATFERALRELRERRRSIGLGWLLRTARNAAIDADRHRRTVADADRRADERHPSQPSPDEAMVGLERAERVRAAVRTLPYPQREAIALRYSTDLTVHSIAALIGKREAATQKLIGRGLARLKEMLDDA